MPPVPKRRRRPRPIGVAVLLAAGGTAAIGVLAAGPWGRPPAPPAALRPDCDHIGGTELASDDRWRIVRVWDDHGQDPGYEPPVPVVACLRHERGPARVRVLGHSDQEDFDGDRIGNTYLDVEGLAAGRLVIEQTQLGTEADVEFATLNRGTYTLIDLDRGRATQLPAMYVSEQDAQGRSDAELDVITHLTPDGGLVWAPTTAKSESNPGVPGAFRIWDAAGQSEAPRGVRQLIPTQNAGTFYTRTAQGKVGRITPDGAAALPKGTTPSLAWRRMELPFAGSADDPGAADDDDGNIEPLGGDYTDGDGPWLEWSGRGTQDPKSTVSVHWYVGDERPLMHLTGHGETARRGLKVLANGLRTALVVGRFADSSGVRRLRLISHYAPAVRFFDRRATPSMEAKGHAAVDAGYSGRELRIALADGDRLLLWGRDGGSVRAVPGAHDLVAAKGGFFMTTAGGTAIFVPG